MGHVVYTYSLNWVCREGMIIMIKVKLSSEKLNSTSFLIIMKTVL